MSRYIKVKTGIELIRKRKKRFQIEEDINFKQIELPVPTSHLICVLCGFEAKNEEELKNHEDKKHNWFIK